MAGRARIGITLRLARRFIPLRGVGKVSYLQGLDVIRACARRLGADAVAAGRFAEVDDAFYLTADELRAPLPHDVGTVVAERRARRIEYQALRLPSTWRGQPVAVTAETGSAGGVGTRRTGVGASPGVVRGRAVVVDDPTETDLDDGDILIAHTTDPSWVSLMFLASALVVDIGGMMSHAAVVAREMGVPAVMNTGDGTTVIETGDLIVVDGAAGTVEIEAKHASRANC